MGLGFYLLVAVDGVGAQTVVPRSEAVGAQRGVDDFYFGEEHLCGTGSRYKFTHTDGPRHLEDRPCGADEPH